MPTQSAESHGVGESAKLVADHASTIAKLELELAALEVKRKVAMYSRSTLSKRSRPAVRSTRAQSRAPFSYGTDEKASSGSIPSSFIRRQVNGDVGPKRSSS